LCVMRAHPSRGESDKQRTLWGTVRTGGSAMTVSAGVSALITTPDTVKTKL
jgi:hypothetical protein